MQANKWVVTGGASGLGRAVVEKALAMGAEVTVIDLNTVDAASFGDCAGTVHTLSADVSDSASVEAAFAKANELMGGIEAVVNCAGILGAGKMLGKEGPMPDAIFEKTIAVNLIGSFFVSRAAANYMQSQPANESGERGVIVHTASVAAYEGQIGQVAYSASKSGIVGMLLPLARELARHGVRINAVAPGVFETPMMEGVREDIRDAILANVPFPKRFGAPSEFADAVLSIVNNAMFNGTCVRLDAAGRLP